MQRHRWAIMAGVCVLLLTIAGAVFVPRILSSSQAGDSTETVFPEHWWQKDLSEGSLTMLETLWGTEISIEEFVRAFYPDVLQELPAQMLDIWQQEKVFWPVAKFEDWIRSPFPDLCFGLTTMGEEGVMECFDVYLGSRALEGTTFQRTEALDLVGDRCYRVSMYASDITEYQP